MHFVKKRKEKKRGSEYSHRIASHRIVSYRAMPRHLPRILKRGRGAHHWTCMFFLGNSKEWGVSTACSHACFRNVLQIMRGMGRIGGSETFRLRDDPLCVCFVVVVSGGVGGKGGIVCMDGMYYGMCVCARSFERTVPQALGDHY